MRELSSWYGPNNAVLVLAGEQAQQRIAHGATSIVTPRILIEVGRSELKRPREEAMLDLSALVGAVLAAQTNSDAALAKQIIRSAREGRLTCKGD